MHRIVRIASENGRVPTKRGVIHRGVGTAERRRRRRASRATQKDVEHCNTTSGQASARRGHDKGELPRDALARPRSLLIQGLARRTCPERPFSESLGDGRVSGPARSAVSSAALL